ncbi:REP-associated tyrosine transposase [Ochrovirga pacifica]|uniref:REP-associated tyrosine transposase n=1 Tax=Ochrovirga pacifica TaxID=1042376 RepID=UPI0004971673|nr:transposase [Ochrovirga pacifica]
MSEKYKVIDSSMPTFITCSFTQWADILTRPNYTSILDESLQFCINEKGLRIHYYVYMTNHIHLIATSAKNKLQEIVRDFKRYTNKMLIQAIEDIGESRREWLLAKFKYEANRTKRANQYKVWKDGFHPVILDTAKKLEQRIHYIHANPVDEGFVSRPEYWKNSSYNFYAEELNYDGGLELTNLFE